MKDCRRDQGFTLLEMLMAMTLLSLLLVALFGGLRFIGHGQGKVETALEEGQALDLVRGLLTRQVAQTFPVMAGANNAPHPLFTGHADRLAFPILRRPGQGPAGLMLAVFDITRQEGVNHLIYREYPFIPGALVAIADKPTRSTDLAASAGAMSFRFRDKTGAWRDAWTDQTSWPQLIALAVPGWPDLIAAPRAEGGAP